MPKNKGKVIFFLFPLSIPDPPRQDEFYPSPAFLGGGYAPRQKKTASGENDREDMTRDRETERKTERRQQTLTTI